MAKELIIRFIKKQIYGVEGPNYFSARFDETKLVKGVRLSEQNQAIVGVAYPDHFFPVSKSSVEEVDKKLTDIKLEKNGAELALKIKIIVMTLKRVRGGMSPYILIVGCTQKKRKQQFYQRYPR